MKKEQKVAT